MPNLNDAEKAIQSEQRRIQRNTTKREIRAMNKAEEVAEKRGRSRIKSRSLEEVTGHIRFDQAAKTVNVVYIQGTKEGEVSAKEK